MIDWNRHLQTFVSSFCTGFRRALGVFAVLYLWDSLGAQAFTAALLSTTCWDWITTSEGRG